MKYVMNVKEPTVVKPVECPSDYVATGEWKEISEKVYTETNKNPKAVSREK